jgi:HEAT repeat protein
MVEFFGLEREQKERVLGGLDQLRAGEREEVLVQALADDSPEIRHKSVVHCRRLKIWKLFPFVMWASREWRGEMRKEAKYCLLTMPADELSSLAERQLGSVVFSMRAYALELLGNLARIDDFHKVAPLLFDYKIDVRDQARKTLRLMIERQLEEETDREDPRNHPPSPQLSEAIQLLFKLADGPDRVTGAAAGDVLIDIGRRYAVDFWKGYQKLSIRGRETIFNLFGKREDPVVLAVIFQGLLVPNDSVVNKCVHILDRLFPRVGAGRLLGIVQSLPEPLLPDLARQMAQTQILDEFIGRFEGIPAPQKDFLFDLIEFVDSRPYSDFLEQCLRNSDELVVYRAVRLLKDMEGRDYTEQFMELLKKENPEILLLVLAYVQKHGSTKCIPPLTRVLAHSDERVTRLALETIFRLSREHLLARYDELSPSSRRDIVQILSRLDESFVEALSEDITRLSSMEKIHLVNILEILGQESKIQKTLKRLSQEPDERVRATVAKALRIFTEAKEKLNLTRAFLDDTDTRVRANAIETIDRVEDQEMMDRLIGLSRSPNSRERANSIKKLWELGYQDFEISLIQMLSDPDEWTRASAVWVLGEIEAPHLVHMIEEKLEDSSPAVRENAVRALGKQGSEEKIRQMTEFLEDSDRRVREAAREVMRKRLKLSYEIQ